MPILEVIGAEPSDRFRVADARGQLSLRRHTLARRARGGIDLPKSLSPGEAAIVGICAATQHDRVAGLVIKHGIGLSAACQKQYRDKQRTSRHVPSLLA